MNKFIGLGRLCADPELKYLESGTKVTNFRLAVQRDYKNKETGKYDADFINCTAFTKTAEFIANNIKKGNRIVVEGQLRTRSYEKEGEKRSVTEVNVNNVDVIDWPEKEGTTTDATPENPWGND